MLEDQVAYLLQRYLGNYVRGLNKEALKISVWQGDVELANMQLKPEALNALKLPIKVKAGFLGSVKLKVPWSRLGQDPVLVSLDRIYLLAEPATHVEGSSEDAIQEAKKTRIREIEMKLLERAHRIKSEMNKSWLGSLINTIIGNLKLSVSNIHIRYEDVESNPGHPFAAGFTLEKLSAVTIDDSGKETFVTGGTMDSIQKSVELSELALYFDSDISPWHIDKPWEDLFPSEWAQVFRFGTKDGKPADHLTKRHAYILQPVTGSAKYKKMRSGESPHPGQPLQKAVVNLDDVTLCLSKDGYRDVLKLADNFAAFNQRLKYAHYRPAVSVKSDPKLWWQYANRAVTDQLKRGSGILSWEQVFKYATLRRRYITLYATLLKSDPTSAVVDDNEEITKFDRELDTEVILQWRMLAHKVVNTALEAEKLKMQQEANSSWWPFRWKSQPSDGDDGSVSFTDEDWEQLNKIIGYKEADDKQPLISIEKPDTLHIFLEIHMKRNASKLYDEFKKCLAELSCEGLDCSIKLYPETKLFEMKLGAYQLSSPEGLLAKSAMASHSLVAAFCYKPFNAKVDWSLVAKASPCYMTYLKDSIGGIVNFFGSSTAVSQTVALETAAALQMTIDEVKHTAQQQMNRALKHQTRFLLDLDIAAPKITIPSDFRPDSIHSTKLLLDLGNLIICSQDDYGRHSLEDLDMYLQFDLVLSDVSAFLIDGDHLWSKFSSMKSASSAHRSSSRNFPLIDKCGVVLTLQQIRIPNPSYPSTRLAVRLPSLGFHFSPSRYHRLMQVAKVFQVEDSSHVLRPWDQADFESWLSLLIWKGREAVWQRHYLCLVGPFLYVLEGPGSKTYKQYISLRGKQLYQVPVDLAGGVEHVLAVSDASRFNNKVVEDANALIIRCDTNESRKTWQSRLQGAIYRASVWRVTYTWQELLFLSKSYSPFGVQGSAPIRGLSDSSSDSEDSEMEQNSSQDAFDIFKMENVFLTGVLDELRICFKYSHQVDLSFMKVLLAEERRLFEFRAAGGKVELSLRGNDMFIGTVLNSLEIEDLVSCSGLSGTCYLARSFIRNEDISSTFDHAENQNPQRGDSTPADGDEEFYEAPESLDDPLLLGRSRSTWLRTPSFTHIKGLLPVDCHETMEEGTGTSESMDSFVRAQISIYDQSSPRYENIDTKVIVTLATLSFFCRRPMVLAILEFGNAMSIEDGSCESFDDNSPTAEHESSIDVIDIQHEETTAKGLLGKGKSRTIFNLTLNMARAQIFLMNEDDTKLATLSQDNLLTDIKVFPASFSIKAALGNLRISDDSLPSCHMYFWICDMRDPEGTSFVELVFTSFSCDDEDYEGYEYFLYGHLSEVRLVYLNRFIQEVISYFMGLVPSSSEGVVKMKDQASNSEKWFTTSEIEGSPAVMLDVSLTKPMIVMPRCTNSFDYLKLDVVHITVKNTFQWFGGDKTELNAIHLETLAIMIEDINLNVGTGAELGDSIIQDFKGVSLIIKRSLRDLLHQIPSTEALIKIEELTAALSNKEYQIVTECALSNISETPRVVPPLNNDDLRSSVDAVQPVSRHQVAVQSQNGETWISLKVSVVINLVELCLYTGMSRDTPLAIVQINGGWLLYKSNTIGEGLLAATLKGFSVIDDREGTKEEFRLAIGKPGDIVCNKTNLAAIDGSQKMVGTHVTKQNSADPFPSMLMLDAKLGQSSTFVSICVQRPQLLVVLDFLLAVVEFFVPTLGSVLSSEEEKCFEMVDATIIDQPVYKQSATEISLSPQKPLIVEDGRFDHFIYDGGGGILLLKSREGSILSSPSTETIIYVGNGKKLQFRNVIIKNGQYLDSCISLGANSSYSVSVDDGVHLDVEDESQHRVHAERSITISSSPSSAVATSMEYVIELQAIGPELTFYNTSKDVGKSSVISNKLMHAQLDAFSRLVLKGNAFEMTADALGLTMESNGVNVLEPFDTSLKYSIANGKTNINVSVSDIFLNFSFSTLRLFLAVEEDILAFLRMTSKKMTVFCSEFDKVGMITNRYTDQIYVFWRPRAPPGFAVLGDYLTPLDKPPTEGVLAVNTTFVSVRRPISFRLIWPLLSSEPTSDKGVSNSDSSANIVHEREICSLWFPEAPNGYVALGCVVSMGRMPPPLSSVFCILASFVSPCSLRDCISIRSPDVCQSNLVCWRVDNSVGSFLPADSDSLSISGAAYELRHVMFGSQEVSPKVSASSHVHRSPCHDQSFLSERSAACQSGLRFEAVASFQLIWWNRGSGSRKKVSIWRPIIAEGLVYFGDIAVQGYEPPNACVVLHDTEEQGFFKPPIDFQLVGRIKKRRAVESVSFWMPQPPLGFVSLGCIACNGTPKQHDLTKLRCIRSDMVVGDQFLEESVWDTSDANLNMEPFSIWTGRSELNTFLVRSGFKRPPRRFALKLADQDPQSGSDDTTIDAEIGTFSAALFDDYGGLMVPLVNASLSNIRFSLHGRADISSSVVSFSLAARSYNDKYESWEPLIEPMEGFLRYQFSPNALGMASQLRLTSPGDLNLNVSVSNANTIIQAYTSWKNLSCSQEYEKEKEVSLSTDGEGSIIGVHQKQNYFVIPQNKLGQDIFIRTTDRRGFKDVVKMPSGDMKAIKVPVSINMLDSHMSGAFCRKNRTMVTIIIMDAQFPSVHGLSSNQYTASVRLTPNQNQGSESTCHQQTARTCGSISSSLHPEVEVVTWSEIFFFKVDSPDDYLLELTVTNMGRGDPVGFFSSPLSQVAGYINDNSNKFDYFNNLIWRELSSAEPKSISHADGGKKLDGKIRCAVLLSPKSKVDNESESFAERKSAFVHISPCMEGPWTKVRLNYATPAACWGLGYDVVASEARMQDGNRYIHIRSLVSVLNHTEFTLDLCLKPAVDDTTHDIPVGPVEPGDTLPLPLSGLTQTGVYVLKLKPAKLPSNEEYSWSSVVSRSGEAAVVDEQEHLEVCVSTLDESERLLSCTQNSGSSSEGSRKLWFVLTIQAVEIAKDIHSDPIHDWTIVVKPPLSITNYLPLGAEFSVLEMQPSGHFVCCSREISGPGENLKVYDASIRKPLYLTLLPQSGWLPIQEAVLISDPHGVPSKTIGFRSSASGRIVHVILEQNYNEDQEILSKMIRVYAPFWFSVARCPPLTLRLLDLGGKKHTGRGGLPFLSKRRNEVILQEITEEEIYEGHTIASALNFKKLGLAASISQLNNEQYGPSRDLSPLGDLDGSLDLFAYAADGKRMQIFLSAKPCPYQSVPTKVISIRPFVTFTNRLGENIYIKLNWEDEPKILEASDSRVSFLYNESGGRDELQVKLVDTDWSFPVQIVKEDTIVLVLRGRDGKRRFVKTEIRGYEEGSRFIVIFRLGPTNGPVRVENRTTSKAISIRQSGFGDDAWIQLFPLSTANFSWEDPYGQKVIDAKLDSGDVTRVCKFDMEQGQVSSEDERELGVQFHVLGFGDVKVARFTDILPSKSLHEEIWPLRPSGNQGNFDSQADAPSNAAIPELIVEVGLVGISVVDHRPKELCYLYLEKVSMSYSVGYDGGRTSRFKLILGHLQIDNQLPLTLMPVLLAPEKEEDKHNPVFKMTITMSNEYTDGIQVFPYVYIRVTDNPWRINIHEPIIWALVDFYNNLRLDHIPQSSRVSQVDPEIRINLIDISEVRLKVSMETAPTQRPHLALGVWSPMLSAIGNAFKIQVHLRRVMHRNRFIRKSSILPAIGNRVWRDLIHNPLHLIFSVDVFGMTSSTLASLSRGFAELSTDGQFLQLRAKQDWSRRITGVGNAVVQGTEALAQGVAFGVSGVVTKPVESARQNGLLGFAHGLGRAFLGFIVQPVSGALDFFSLTIDGIGASCTRCLEVLNHRATLERIRNPRAVHADGVLREYCEKEAVGQMVLHIAEASRQFGCAEIFREPSKFALSDYYEEHFIVPYKRIVLVTNKRVMLLQCPDLEKMDKRPSKIIWDIPWENLMALELAKAGFSQPSHLILHLKDFRRAENFVRVIKCNIQEESSEGEAQAVKICSVVRKVWKAYQSNMKNLTLKVPSSQRHVCFAWNEADGRESRTRGKSIFKLREISSSSSAPEDRKFVKHTINFTKIWSSEREAKGRCTLCKRQVSDDGGLCTIWRPICPHGFISIGDIAHVGTHPPTVAAVYHNTEKLFALPVGYDLVWRNCLDDYALPVSIWHPRAPEGFVSPGCVAVPGFSEPDPDTVHCVAESLAEETGFEEQKIWSSPDSYPWACHIYQVRSDALPFVALRQPKEDSNWKAMRVRDDSQLLLLSSELQCGHSS